MPDFFMEFPIPLLKISGFQNHLSGIDNRDGEEEILPNRWCGL